jgi:hypothetical protein
MFELMMDMKTKIKTSRNGEIVDKKMNKVGRVGKTGSCFGFSML